MNAIEFLTSLIRSGKLYGLGIGSTLDDVNQSIRCDFIDDVSKSGLSMRRDYGFFEFSFKSGPEWVISAVSIQLHRLASNFEMAEEWQRGMGTYFPQYTAWRELQGALSRVQEYPSLTVKDQGDFIEYRADSTNVSIIVNNDHEERDCSVGQGDLWSVSLWSATRSE
ncbi:hypothetical protein ACIO8F_41900 [Streptomyces sp. NPDC087228]|uniref:hypothetical protein n=1 Tax=Streptomyces sp. NPDC087228 TaxID=3365772 RepID=UPI003825122A